MQYFERALSAMSSHIQLPAFNRQHPPRHHRWLANTWQRLTRICDSVWAGKATSERACEMRPQNRRPFLCVQNTEGAKNALLLAINAEPDELIGANLKP